MKAPTSLDFQDTNLEKMYFQVGIDTLNKPLTPSVTVICSKGF
jgi:hypothetical protein